VAGREHLTEVTGDTQRPEGKKELFAENLGAVSVMGWGEKKPRCVQVREAGGWSLGRQVGGWTEGREAQLPVG
jgi:hypothetical protein